MGFVKTCDTIIGAELRHSVHKFCIHNAIGALDYLSTGLSTIYEAQIVTSAKDHIFRYLKLLMNIFTWIGMACANIKVNSKGRKEKNDEISNIKSTRI